jgi:hypothetical protein
MRDRAAEEREVGSALNCRAEELRLVQAQKQEMDQKVAEITQQLQEIEKKLPKKGNAQTVVQKPGPAKTPKKNHTGTTLSGKEGKDSVHTSFVEEDGRVGTVPKQSSIDPSVDRGAKPGGGGCCALL